MSRYLGHIFFFLFFLSYQIQTSAQFSLKREFRGVWIATVANIDWPSSSGLSSKQQQAEFEVLLDLLKQRGINAVIVQIRPVADAFFQSAREPWSAYLNGKVGRGPVPHYDPLAFMIEATHKRGMEFHAWFNPYRAAVNVSEKGIDSTSLAFQQPDWFLLYGNTLYFNPGLPEVRAHVINVIADVVMRYNIEAVHFDDYFYPYRIVGQEFPDSVSYRTLGKGMPIDDWRRENVNLLIESLSDTLQKIKPHVQLGVSPFGVWRNRDKDSRGSDTHALQTCYDDLYADVLLWMEKGWIDYVVPQAYLSLGHPLAPYDKIMQWWNDNANGVAVYAGQASYRIGVHTDSLWREPTQLHQQMRYNGQLPHVKGSVFFSAKSFRANALGFADTLQYHTYKDLAIPPPVKKLQTPTAVFEPQVLIFADQQGAHLLWCDSKREDLSSSARYVVYRGIIKKGKITLAKPLIVLPESSHQWYNYHDNSVQNGVKYGYFICELNKYQQEVQSTRSWWLKKHRKSFKSGFL